MEDRPELRPDGFEELKPSPRRRKKRKSVLELVLQDILLTGLILTVFALFHHVIPRLTAAGRETPTPTAITRPTAPPATTPAAAEEPSPPIGTDALPEETDPAAAATPEPTPEPTPDPLDWRTKFAEHFTDEIVVTDDSYTSPNISIHIEKLVTDDIAPSTCYIADVYVASIENFQTYWATGSYRYYGADTAQNLARDSLGLLTVNGDYADNQTAGFLVRNGELYMSEQTVYDICVLYYDGTMKTYGPNDYKVEDVLADKPWQVWKFGPALLDEDGQPKTSYNTSSAICDVNPRSGVGYYEPGHYVFVIVDGRQPGYSTGMRIERFAKLFADLGCSCAYNLDGGQSAIMTFQQKIISRPYLGGRDSGDILLIRELDDNPEG